MPESSVELTPAIFSLCHSDFSTAELGDLIPSRDQLRVVLERACSQGHLHAVAIIRTCHRLEIIHRTADAAGADLFLTDALRELVPPDRHPLLTRARAHRGPAAITRLLRIAAGLESAVLGEVEVLGQLRRTLDDAQRSGLADRWLIALLQRALRFGRRVREQTGIARGQTSVASAGLRLAEEAGGGLAGARALLVGSGSTAALIADHLRDAGLASLTLASRPSTHATRLAADLRLPFHPLSDLALHLADCDLAIFATAAPQPLLNAAMLAHRTAPLVILDLSLPPNVDPGVATLPQITLIGLDQIEAHAAESRSGREREIAAAEALLTTEANATAAWLATIPAQELIADVRRRFGQIRAVHLERHSSDATRPELDQFGESLLRALLHDITGQLRAINLETAEGQQQFVLLKQLFPSNAGR